MGSENGSKEVCSNTKCNHGYNTGEEGPYIYLQIDNFKESDLSNYTLWYGFASYVYNIERVTIDIYSKYPKWKCVVLIYTELRSNVFRVIVNSYGGHVLMGQKFKPKLVQDHTYQHVRDKRLLKTLMRLDSCIVML